jgi:hypothetical protein
MVDHYNLKLDIPAGIQRDGTQFDSEYCVDGDWVRWYRNRPKKMGGYKYILSLGNIVTNMYVVPLQNQVAVYMGTFNNLYVQNVSLDGLTVSALKNITPSLFVGNVNNNWTFDTLSAQIKNSAGILVTSTFLIAHVAQNYNDLTNNYDGPVYYYDINTTIASPVVAQVLPGAGNWSGGIVAVPPYLFAFGDFGQIAWSKVFDGTAWSTAQIAGNKMLCAKRVRGGGAPAALFWSVTSLVQATFSGGAGSPDAFSFDTKHDDISILSKDSVIEYNGIYYWPGTNQFFMYNGVVNTMPNVTNANWFYDNLNISARTKLFGISNGRYKELWWHAPMFGSTINNHAIIFNTDEATAWYDAAISRSCGFKAQIFPKPMLFDYEQNVVPGSYALWQHEYGYDRDFNGVLSAIPSFYETKIYMLASMGGPDDRQLRIRRMEPDFTQVGPIEFVIKYRAFPDSLPAYSDTYVFTDSTKKVDTFVQGRQVSFVFGVVALGAYYEQGDININYVIGDATPQSGELDV